MIKATSNAEKKCRAEGCVNTFTPWNSTQIACSMTCAIKVVEQKRSKAFKKETLGMKRAFNKTDRRYQLKKAQEAFNAFIRERDKDLPCISSGRTTGQMHAGHYKSTAACPELRFDERNCNKQSMKDNSWLSGNILGYRQGMIERYGIKVVEEIEGPHEPKKHTIDQLVSIKEEYRRKLKELQC